MTQPDKALLPVTQEDREAKLLPCPFCGGSDSHVDDRPIAGGDDWNRRYGVVCADCGASSGWYNTQAEAIAAWNTRLSASAEVERLREALGREQYALGLIVEEMAEVLKLIGKGLRFGMDAPGPDNSEYQGQTAREMLLAEIGDTHAAIRFAAMAGLFRMSEANEHEEAKMAKLLDPKARDAAGNRLAPALTPEQST